jgi:hypothetical protein
VPSYAPAVTLEAAYWQAAAESVRDPEAVGRAAVEAAEVLMAKGGKVPLWKEEEKNLKVSGCSLGHHGLACSMCDARWPPGGLGREGAPVEGIGRRLRR